MRLMRAFIPLGFFKAFTETGRGIQMLPSLPEDAQLRTVQFDEARGGWWLLIESASFAEVGEGYRVPDTCLQVHISQTPEDFVDYFLAGLEEEARGA